jgi:hypothetical protein
MKEPRKCPGCRIELLVTDWPGGNAGYNASPPYSCHRHDLRAERLLQGGSVEAVEELIREGAEQVWSAWPAHDQEAVRQLAIGLVPPRYLKQSSTELPGQPCVEGFSHAR